MGATQTGDSSGKIEGNFPDLYLMLKLDGTLTVGLKAGKGNGLLFTANLVETLFAGGDGFKGEADLAGKRDHLGL